MKNYINNHKKEFYQMCDTLGAKYQLAYRLFENIDIKNINDINAYMKTTILSNKKEIGKTNTHLYYGALLERLKTSNFVGNVVDILYIESLLNYLIENVTDFDTIQSFVNAGIEGVEPKNYIQLGKYLTNCFDSEAPIPKVALYRKAQQDSKEWGDCLRELKID